jgi:ACS family hexuronate transporter-like MFS transporter
MQAGSPSRVRLSVAFLLFLVTTINFSDRGILGAVAPVLIKNFHLTTAQFGVVASAFSWGYVLTTFLGGFTIALFKGPKRAYMTFVTIWSIALGATVAATGFVSLLIYRIIFGLSEGVVFPSSQQIAGRWFPPKEQGRISAWCLTLGQPIGPLIATPVSIAIAAHYGWRLPFIVWMLIGIIWVVAAGFVLTNRPQEHKGVNRAELQLIGERPETNVTEAIRSVISNGYLWICGFCFFAAAYVLYFMLTFFPLYLVQERHLAYANTGFLATTPFIGLAIGALFSGWAMDRIFVKTGGNLYKARTVLGAVCLFLTGATFLVLANGNWTLGPAITLMFLGAAFAYAANPVFFAMPMDIVPEHAGAAGALVTGIASSAGIIAPLVTGQLVQASGSYASAIDVIAWIPIAAGIVLLAVNPLGRAMTKQALRSSSSLGAAHAGNA